MSSLRDRDRVVRFEDAVRRYVSTFPAASRAKNPSQLIDLIVSARQYGEPSKSYREHLYALLREDPELARLYNA
jgi:hypothetical protein